MHFRVHTVDWTNSEKICALDIIYPIIKNTLWQRKIRQYKRDPGLILMKQHPGESSDMLECIATIIVTVLVHTSKHQVIVKE